MRSKERDIIEDSCTCGGPDANPIIFCQACSILKEIDELDREDKKIACECGGEFFTVYFTGSHAYTGKCVDCGSTVDLD